MTATAAGPRSRTGRAAARATPPLLVLFGPLTQLSFIPVSVGIGRDIGLSEAQIGLSIAMHSVATAVASLLVGPLLDLVPVRRVLLPAVTVSAATSIWLCLHVTYGSLVVGRALSGLATGAVALCSFALVTDLARGDAMARDRSFSLLQTFTAVGAATALGLGAVSAALDRPWLVFAAGAVLGVVLVVLVLLTPSAPSVAAGAVPADRGWRSWSLRIRTVLGGVGRMLGQPRTVWLMVCAAGLGLVIQGAHYGVSVLLEGRADDIALWQRVLLSVLIPCGVFTGSSINRRALRSWSRERLYAVLWAVLPAAVAVYAVLSALGAPLVALAGGLLVVGTCLGAMMPQSAAISDGGFTELRGSATAAESLARSAGQTMGPLLVGIVVAASSVSWAGVVIAVAAVLGCLASLLVTRSHRRAVAEAPVPQEVTS